MVRLEHVSKEYERGNARVVALRSVTLEVVEGEFCALMGPSGCGKSTLVNLIAGLDLPTSGELFLNGRSTKHFSDSDWTTLRREFIGIVFQAFYLIPSLTAEENVALPLYLRGDGRGEVHRRAAESLDLVSMRHRANHRPSELSGGEQQRVAIARALVHHPRLVLADEPTGNLDSTHGAEVIQLLRSLPATFGQAVVLVTHSPAAAQQADRVHLLRDGQLEAVPA